jgi:hypothetical protein
MLSVEVPRAQVRVCVCVCVCVCASLDMLSVEVPRAQVPPRPSYYLCPHAIYTAPCLVPVYIYYSRGATELQQRCYSAATELYTLLHAVYLTIYTTV